MQIKNICKVNFGQLQLDKEANECFQTDAVANLKNVHSVEHYAKKLQFAENSAIDFFINGDGEHTFRAVAIDQKSGKYFGRQTHTSVHHTINNIIDVVLKRLKKQII